MRYSHGTWSYFDAPHTGTNPGSALYGINERGTEAAGQYWDASGRSHGYVVRLTG